LLREKQGALGEDTRLGCGWPATIDNHTLGVDAGLLQMIDQPSSRFVIANDSHLMSGALEGADIVCGIGGTARKEEPPLKLENRHGRLAR
jgi:hypothetical protein